MTTWNKLEDEGLKLRSKLNDCAKKSESDGEKLNKEAEDFAGRLTAALAGAKIQKDNLAKWIAANL